MSKKREYIEVEIEEEADGKRRVTEMIVVEAESARDIVKDIMSCDMDEDEKKKNSAALDKEVKEAAIVELGDEDDVIVYRRYNKFYHQIIETMIGPKGFQSRWLGEGY